MWSVSRTFLLHYPVLVFILGRKCLSCERCKTLFCRNKGLESLESILQETNLTAIKRLASLSLLQNLDNNFTVSS